MTRNENRTRESDRTNVSREARESGPSRGRTLSSALRQSFSEDETGSGSRDPIQGDTGKSGRPKEVGPFAPDPGRYRVPNGEEWHVPAPEHERRTGQVDRSRAIKDALRSGEATEFVNSEGERQEIRLTPHDDSGYQLQLGDGVRVVLDGIESPRLQAHALERITDYYSQVPEHLRGAADSIRVTNQPGPQVENGTTLAHFNPRGNEIVFFDGLRNLNEQVFQHEYGHAVGSAAHETESSFLERIPLIGRLFQRSNDFVPEGYRDAVEANNGAPSEYGSTNLAEDFAESYVGYHEAREANALEQFRERFPHRSRVLDEIFSGA